MQTPHCLSAPPEGYILPDGTDSRQVAVVTRDYWSRLHYQLNKKAIDKQRMEEERAAKQALRDQSKAMIKTWTNTLQGARKKRLEERQKRLDAKEAEAKVLDIDEARFQAEKRREAIQKAKQLLYYQTDRVKEFHSALRLTEVLKERDAQLEMKKLRDQGISERDKVWYELSCKQKEEWEKQEAEKLIRWQNAAMENTTDIVKQINEKSLEREKLRHLNRQEGDKLQQLADEYSRDVEEKNKKIREQRMKNMNETVKQMEERRLLLEKERKQNEAEDEECRMYVNAKKNMMHRRAEREAAIENEKRAINDRIYAKLSALQKAHVDDEQERFDKANAEREAREVQEAAERRRRIEEAALAAAEHRAEQMKRLEEAKAEAKKVDYEEARLQREADLIYARNEEEKLHRRRVKAASLAQLYLREVDEEKRVQAEDKEREVGEALLNMELQLHEEDMFQQYAKSVIDNLDKRGRNTIPLKRVAAKKPPIVIPTLMNQEEPGDAKPTEGQSLGLSTYKRLGFVYAGN